MTAHEDALRHLREAERGIESLNNYDHAEQHEGLAMAIGFVIQAVRAALPILHHDPTPSSTLLDLIPDELRGDAEREIDQTLEYFTGGADMGDIIDELLELIGSERLKQAWDDAQIP